MARHDINKIVITTKDGKDHTFEGPGSVLVKRTYRVNKDVKPHIREPVARVEVTMSVEAEWKTGEGDVGRFVDTPGTTL